MVDLSAHHMNYRSSTVRAGASGRAVAYGLVVAASISIALWGAILWAAVHVI